jgi:hypothetical protein
VIADRGDRCKVPQEAPRGGLHHYTMSSLLQEIKEKRPHFIQGDRIALFQLSTSEHGAAFRPFLSGLLVRSEMANGRQLSV